MDIKYTLILCNVILMFIIMVALFLREKSKTKKLQKEFGELKFSVEQTKEEVNIETKIRQLKDKADSIIDDMNGNMKNDINKLSNKKIMEFEEYATQLFDKIEMNHREVVFLYDMLNEKSEFIKEQMISASKLQKELANVVNYAHKNGITMDSSVDDKEVIEDTHYHNNYNCERFDAGVETVSSYFSDDDDDEKKIPIKEFSSDYQLQNEKIIKLYAQGYSTIDISKKLGIGTGEVALINNLYKNKVIV